MKLKYRLKPRAIAASLFAFALSATSSVLGAYTPTYMGGEGTENNPYTIGSAEALAEMAEYFADPGKTTTYIKITQSFSCSNVNYEPPIIGSQGSGTRLAGHKVYIYADEPVVISGLTVSKTGNVGLIGEVAESTILLSIKNITLSGVTIDGNDASANGAGAFVGWFPGNALVLDNCHVVNSTVGNSKQTGGLVGYLMGNGTDPYATFTDCSIENSTINAGTSAVGGFVGYCCVPTATITGGVSSGNTFNSTLQDLVGSFVGRFNSSTTVGTLSDITASGNKAVLSSSEITDIPYVGAVLNDATYTVVESANDVKFGSDSVETAYASFEDLAASWGATYADGVITLNGDSAASQRVYFYKDVIIDLNGYTLTLPASDSRGFYVDGSSFLTLKTSREGGRFVHGNTGCISIYVRGGSKLECQGGIYEADGNFIYNNGGTISIVDGVYTVNTSCVVIWTGSGTSSISGGYFNVTRDITSCVADGKRFSEVSSGTYAGYYVVENDPDAIPVAQIGDKVYYRLQNALNAGGEVRLLRNVVLAESEQLIVNADATLELNGFSVTRPTGGSNTMIGIYANLTVQDSVGGSVISTIGNIKCAVMVYQGGTLDLKSGTISGDWYDVYNNRGTVIATGGVFCGQGQDGALINYGGGRIEISGTTQVRGKGITNYDSQSKVSLTGGLYELKPDASFVASGYAVDYGETMYEVVSAAEAKPLAVPAAWVDADVVEIGTSMQMSLWVDCMESNLFNPAGKTLKLTADITLPANITYYSNNKTGIKLDGYTIDGDGHTLTVTGASADYCSAIWGVEGTVKNLTMAGAQRGVFVTSATGNVVLENVTFGQGIVYTMNTGEDNENCELIVRNSTLNGWTSFGEISKATFTDCVFTEGNGQKTLRPWVNAIVENCTFNDGFLLDNTAQVGQTLLVGCVTEGGAVITQDQLTTILGANAAGAIVYGQYVAQIVTNEGVTTNKYLTLAAAVSAASAGDTITMLADDNMSLTAGQEVTIDKSLTITGPVDENGDPLYTIYGTANQTGYNDIYINAKGISVTISNLNIRQFGNHKTGSDDAHAVIYVGNQGCDTTTSLTLNNLRVSEFNRRAIAMYRSTFAIDGCVIDCVAEDGYASFKKGIEIFNDATGEISDTTIVNMTSGSSVVSTTAGIECYGNGDVLVSGCTIEGLTTGIATAGFTGMTTIGTITVEDCTIDAGYAALYGTTLAGTYGENGTTLRVVSGTYSGGTYVVSADAGSVVIDGGNFVGTFDVGEEGTGSIAVSGGLFDQDPGDYCAPGYASTFNTDESTSAVYMYTVLPAVASITVDAGTDEEETVYFATFDDAIDAALDDQTIVVINYNAETMVAPEGWKFSTDVSVVPPVTTLVRTVSVEVTFELGDNPPENAVIPGPGTYAAGSALPSATCPDTNTSFAGWKVKNSDPELVISALPLDVTDFITLVATWTVTKTVTVTESETTVSINVTDDWIKDNVEKAGETATTAEIQAALEKEDTNGLPAWQNYVLGQDPNANVAAGAEQGAVDAMPVVSTVTPQTVDTGFKVEYRLDAVDTNGNVVASTEAQATPDLTVDLTKLTSENNVAYYKTVAVITSTTDPNVTVTVPSTNTIGVLKVESGAKTTAVAVPWASYDGTNDISVADIVRTANLTLGDELKAYAPDGSGYKAWTLDESKAWQPNITATKTDSSVAPTADDFKVKRGSAVWLTRADPSQPIYLVGGVAETEKAKVTLEEGTTDNPSWNLVGSAGTEPVNVATLLNANPGDKISVPTASVPKEYIYKDGQWGYMDSETYLHTNKVGRVSQRTRDVFVVDDNYIPAGTGFWYQNSTDKSSIDL